MDDTTRDAVVGALCAEVRALYERVATEPGLSLATAEEVVQAGLRQVGARLLERGLAARGSGHAGPRRPCPCGGAATFEGYRTKGVQTLLGWITLRRAYYWCPCCRRGQLPLDHALGLARDSTSPGARRLASRFGALLPFPQAAATLAAATGVQLSASTLRTLTEAAGARQEATVRAEVEQAWAAGLAPVPGPARELLYVAMDGVLVLDTAGQGMEAKVGMVVPVRRDAGGERRLAASYAVSFAPAAAFGQRLALEAHRRGLERAQLVVVLGDGAAWIWALAEEHFPGAICIVDWFHASERIWALGRALYGEGMPKTAAWVEHQLERLRQGKVRRLVAAWKRLKCTGAAAAVREEQVTYFTNQAPRMAYDRYRELGLDIGSGMIESANKSLIAMREKGPGMRWREANAQAVANLRVLLANDQWDAFWEAA